MAQAAGLDFLADEGGREVTLSVSGLGIAPPDDITALVEEHGKPHFRVVTPAKWPPALLRARPVDVS